MHINRLHPGPSSLACGWEGHNEQYPSPQEIGRREGEATARARMGSHMACRRCAREIRVYPQLVNGTVQWWPSWHPCTLSAAR